MVPGLDLETTLEAVQRSGGRPSSWRLGVKLKTLKAGTVELNVGSTSDLESIQELKAYRQAGCWLSSSRSVVELK